MTLIWQFLVTLGVSLPWLVIGVMAALALWRKRDSVPLILQVMGAIGMFVLPFAQWLIADLLLRALNAGSGVIHPTNIIFKFLIFVALVIFALGYVLERWKLSKPAQVTATRVD
jgi:hypothetical protein